MQAEALEQECHRLWALLKDAYTGPNGLVNSYVDPFSGKVVRTQNTIQDYGDYAQIAGHYGNRYRRPEFVEWAVQQVLIGASLYQTRAGYFLVDGSTHDSAAPRKPARYFRLEDNTDLFMGVVALYGLTRDPRLLPAVDRFVGFLERRAGAWLPGNVFQEILGFAAPIPVSLPDGLLAEDLVLLARWTGNERYLRLAELWMGDWLHCPYFEETALFPVARLRMTELPAVGGLVSLAVRSLAPGQYGKSRRSILIKSNTNMLSALLKLYEDSGNPAFRKAAERWLHACESKLMRDDGYFFGTFSADQNRAEHGKYPLADNHHLATAFLDAHLALGDRRYLQAAEKNASFWLAHRSPLGLFPELYKPGFERATVLDMHVDYTIVLLKLHAVTGKQAYLEEAQAATAAALRHFHAEHGLKWCIQADTGENMKPMICSKFLSLFTKLLLLLEAAERGKNIVKEPLLHDLTRDR